MKHEGILPRHSMEINEIIDFAMERDDAAYVISEEIRGYVNRVIHEEHNNKKLMREIANLIATTHDIDEQSVYHTLCSVEFDISGAVIPDINHYYKGEE